MTDEPPRLVTAVLRRGLPKGVVGASILGDLREEYEQNGRWRRTRYAGAALVLAVQYAALRLAAAAVRRFRQGRQTQGRRPVVRIAIDDVLDAWRSLRRRPLFAAAGVALLGCGLAATSIVASFVDAVLFRPLPMVRHLESLVRIQERVDKPPSGRPPFRNVVPVDMERIAALPSIIATAAILDGGAIPIATPEGASRIPTVHATAGFFDVLGVEPAIGRRFTVDDERPGRPGVVVLSHGAWERIFGGRADAIGSTLTLNRESHTVIGVMPRGFRFPDGPDVYVPLKPSRFTSRFHVATGLARVRPGVPLERVESEVGGAIAALSADDPVGGHGTGARVLRWRDAATESVRPAMLILAAAAALVLVLATANLAGLLAERTISRRRELSIRRSLGATSAAVVRLLVAEGLLLAIGGTIAGLAVAAVTLQAVVSLSPADLPFREAVRLDTRVVLFTALVAAIAGLVPGVFPARRSRHRAPAAGERSGPGTGTVRSGRVLVVAQIAVAMVLACGAAVLIRSFVVALRVDPGVRVEGILTASVTLNDRRYDDEHERRFFDQASRENSIGIEPDSGAKRLSSTSAALVLALTGVALGTLLAIRTTQGLRSLLYRTEPGDPLTSAAAGGLTLVVTLIAVITPAIRAARVDPVAALRVE